MKEIAFEEKREGFDIQLTFEEEFVSPTDTVMGFDDKESLQKIYNGEYTWLIATVTASKKGVELGNTSLGGVSYKWDKLNRFWEEKDGYYEDMVKEVIEEAKETLQSLCE